VRLIEKELAVLVRLPSALVPSLLLLLGTWFAWSPPPGRVSEAGLDRESAGHAIGAGHAVNCLYRAGLPAASSLPLSTQATNVVGRAENQSDVHSINSQFFP
jgi:hypothetical protein